MALTTGTRFGPYEIIALVGAGGMGEVYQARDTNLDRPVAIKILPESFAHDPDRLARFEREAKTLASLNHPNIAVVHGFEQGALVMELVDGPTLADRIAEGPVPMGEALAIARQIADALDAAHSHNIIHRDLKPANIKLRPDGTVKVLDFGLAKALDAEASGSAARPLSYSPTITSPGGMTGMGVVLGTAAYMAPEQARGKPVDKRADIWAFGCVLYEMLSGRPAFDGAEVTDILARVIEREPDVTRLPSHTPTAIRRLLRRCLEKDYRRRLADIADARLEIDDAGSAPGEGVQAASKPPRATWRRAGAIAAVILIAGAAAFGGWMLRPTDRRQVARFAITLAPGDTLTGSLAVSPDGKRLSYAINDRLYLRSIDQLEPVLVAGGNDVPPLASARTPFFSPDSQWLGFWESGQLKKVSVSGGAPTALCEFRPPPAGATWAEDNTILLGHNVEGVWRVSGDGGTAERIITLGPGQRAGRPQLLPDGRVLFTLASTANWDEAQIVIQSIGGDDRKTVVSGGTDGRYLPTGHLVYALGTSLLAAPLDLRAGKTTSGPVPVLDGVLRQGGALGASLALSVSADATLLYMPAASGAPRLRSLVWVDRRGREQQIAATARAYQHPRISPDATRLAVEYPDEKENSDVWVTDVAGGAVTRVTTDPARDGEPVWSPDGQQIFFTSTRSGSIGLYRQAANGGGSATTVSSLNRQSRALPAFTPDGEQVVIRAADLGNSFVAIVNVADGAQKTLVKTPFEEYNGEVSPNGQWLAYQSNKSGAFEIYVQPFPDAGNDLWPVSSGGGAEPVWGRDGRELFYRAPDGAVMQVTITPGSTWKASAPTQLFAGSSYATAASADFRNALARTFDVAPDGQRFLMLKYADTRAQNTTPSRIVVVQNWFEELQSKVRINK